MASASRVILLSQSSTHFLTGAKNTEHQIRTNGIAGGYSCSLRPFRVVWQLDNFAHFMSSSDWIVSLDGDQALNSTAASLLSGP
jgi:hypothetical protein